MPSERSSLSAIAALDDDLAPAPKVNLTPAAAPEPGPVPVQAEASTRGITRMPRGKGSQPMIARSVEVLADQVSPAEAPKKQISFRIEVDLDDWLDDMVYALKKKGKKVNREQIINEAIRMMRAIEAERS